MNKSGSRTEEILKKPQKTQKTPVALSALLPHCCFTASRGARGAVLDLEHPEGCVLLEQSGCPDVPGVHSACHCSAETAWEELQRQQCSSSVALTALWSSWDLTGLGMNLADAEEGGRAGQGG